MFHNARNSLHKLLRKCERNYNNNIISNIEHLGKNNHNQFWNTIKQLGPKKKDIPLKVEKESNIVSNVENVLNVWKNDFEQLYNPPTQSVDHEFVNFVNDEKTHLEISFNNIQNTNDVLNSPITCIEVRRSILLSKKNKTPSVDLIPNKVIKNPNICEVLFTLFNFCFQNHILPNLWLKSIVKSIPKNPEKSPYVPLN